MARTPVFIPFEIVPSDRRMRLIQRGAVVAALILSASPAAADCLSPTEVQAGGMVVYKCGESGSVAGPAFTEQQPSNQTVILKNEVAAGDSVPAGAGPGPQAPEAAGKLEAKLNEEVTTENKSLSLSAPAKKTAKTKSASKTKHAVKRKKRKAVKPSRIIHLKKPSLGTRIKSFFGL